MVAWEEKAPKMRILLLQRAVCANAMVERSPKKTTPLIVSSSEAINAAAPGIFVYTMYRK